MKIVVKTADRVRQLGSELARQFLAHPNGLLVTIEPYKRPRSTKQNSKIHAMIADIAEFTGDDFRDMKEVVKSEFYPHKTMRVGEGEFRVPLSTAELSRDEASMVIEKLHRAATKIGATIKEQ